MPSRHSATIKGLEKVSFVGGGNVQRNLLAVREPIVLRINEDEGHFGEAGVDGRLKSSAEELAFLMTIHASEE